MTNKKIALEITRTLTVLDNLLHKEKLTMRNLVDKIRDYYAVNFPDSVPSSFSLMEYYAGRRAMSIDSVQDMAGVPSVLMVIELLYEGASDIYFHPLFNMAFGPVRSKVLTWRRGSAYPQEWIDALIARRDRIDYRISLQRQDASERLGANENRTGASDSVDDVIADLEEARLNLSAELKYAAEHDNSAKKARRERWRLDDPLGWIHTNMLHLAPALQHFFMVKPGSRATWRRNFREITEEISAIGPVADMENVALMWALTLEAAEIGNLDRFVQARSRLREMIPQLSDLPSLNQSAGTMQAVMLTLIDDTYLRCYAPGVRDNSGKPPEWETLKKQFWKASPPRERK